MLFKVVKVVKVIRDPDDLMSILIALKVQGKKLISDERYWFQSKVNCPASAQGQSAGVNSGSTAVTTKL